MESTPELKLRFQAAFKRYSAASTLMRAMRAALPDHVDSIQIHELNEQSRILSRAESDYQTARLAYADRLPGDNARR